MRKVMLQYTQLDIVRSKVTAPLASAVTFVYDEPSETTFPVQLLHFSLELVTLANLFGCYKNERHGLIWISN